MNCKWCGLDKAVHTEKQWEIGQEYSSKFPQLIISANPVPKKKNKLSKSDQE